MKALRAALLVLGIVCTLVFFTFTMRYAQTPEGEHRSWSLGLVDDPWLKQDRAPGQSPELVIDFLSWSWLVLIVACAAFWAYRRLGCMACSEPAPAPAAK
ncbi:MAG TPA: hypothetical protein VKD90_27515 [Gemmataceae bacterium]|nr:hypothetical protein [Gemmataceae bacterium]